MAVPPDALKKDNEFVGLNIKEITQKLSNRAVVELLKHIAINMKSEHFSDARSFSFNKGQIQALMRISNMTMEDAKEIWKKVPDKTKKYWKIIFETDLSAEGGPLLITDEKILNKEKHRYYW